MKTYNLHCGQLILYDVNETAQFLGCTPRTVRRMIYDQRLPAAMIKRSWYVWERNIYAYLTGAKEWGKRNTKVDPTTFPVASYQGHGYGGEQR